MKSKNKNKKLDKKEAVEAAIEEKAVSKAKKVDKKEKKSKETKVNKTKEESFFKQVIKELKRVKWPDKKYMVKYATATFVTIVVSSVYFYAIFALFSFLKGLR